MSSNRGRKVEMPVRDDVDNHPADKHKLSPDDKDQSLQGSIGQYAS
jgi:hypothetical protein